MAETGQFDDTQMTTTDAGSASTVSTFVPALTILAHPDEERIGARSVLPLLALEREARLARLEPVFESPEGELRPRPLDERSISRSPILLRGVSAGGEISVCLDVRTSRTRVLADGSAIEGEHLLEAAALDRGCVLQVGRRVVLLLHRVAFSTPEPTPRFGLIGESEGVVRLRQELLRLAPLDVPVLLRGESGTGKELAARALHEGGPRRAGPFVAVNMATLPPSLAAGQLFGAARGAYTGADRKQIGFFEGAEGGTLFLDEIGETPPEVQAMLLRALESREILPVGSIRAKAIHVRVIAATDALLEQAMADGTFRAPLFHRLAGYSLRLPPLRERREDLGILLRHFLTSEWHALGASPDGPLPFPPAEVMVRLARHDWPGNVRELRNVARRLAIIGPASDRSKLLEGLEGLGISKDRLPEDRPSAPQAGTAAGHRVQVAEPSRRRASDLSDEEVLEALRTHRWDVLNTAKGLGISRSSLYRSLEKRGLGRKASDLDSAEIQDALQRASGDLAVTAEILEVSEHALRRDRKARPEVYRERPPTRGS